MECIECKGEYEILAKTKRCFQCEVNSYNEAKPKKHRPINIFYKWNEKNRSAALILFSTGLTHIGISEELKIPRSTISRWIRNSRNGTHPDPLSLIEPCGSIPGI